MTTTNGRTLCCSDTCEKRFECDRSDINHIGTYYVEDYSSFGTGTYTDNGCEVEHWCGRLGDYKMFEPIEPTVITITQELDLGSDEELQEYIDELGYTGLITPEQTRNIIKGRLHKLFKDSLKT